MTPSQENSPDLVRFGPFTYDRSTSELRKAGTTVALRPKATSVLSALIEADGRLVPREELVDRAWGDTVLESEQALHTVIKQIRGALGDSATDPQFVETVHRRGYRFIGRPQPPAPRRVGPRLLATTIVVTSLLVGGAVAITTTSDRDLTDSEQLVHAQYLVARGSTDDVRRAIDLLEPLTDIDDQSPDVWSTLAAAYARLSRFDDAERYARRSLDLDDQSSEAHRVLAETAMMRDRAWDTARAHFLRALTIDPNSAPVHGGYAFLLLLTGSLEESVREMRRALSLDPMSTLINADAAYVFYWAGNYDEAERQALRTLDIEPSFSPALEILRVVRLAREDYPGARTAALASLQVAGAASHVIDSVAYGPARLGLQAFAKWKVARAKGRLSIQRPDSWVWYGLALAELGRVDESINAFERARELGAPFASIVPLDHRLRDARAERG